MSKKDNTLIEIFKICLKRKNFVFHNDLVKDISKKYGFGNPFDATKLDNKNKLPNELIDNNVAIIHLGNGYHRFVEGIDKVYHDFEPIQKEIEWRYKRSLLNLYNTSESNILSVANNQRILHHFLFGKDSEFDNIDIIKRPKTYFPHRTKANFTYYYGKDLKVELDSIQIEIDLTIEFQGIIGVFEGKNGKPDNFAIYQIYHPFLYYYQANKDSNIKGQIKKIICVYVVKTISKNNIQLKLWSYTFKKPYDITSIEFLKSICYKLIQ